MTEKEIDEQIKRNYRTITFAVVNILISLASIAISVIAIINALNK